MKQNDESKMETSSPPAVVAATPTQAGETRAPWEWVERTVWTERMLSRLGSTEEQAKIWFSLMDKVYAPASLRSAFTAVWQNRGSAGVDGQTVGQFDAHAEAELARLHEQLRRGTYRPHPARRVWIPKPGSKEQRPLGIPTVSSYCTCCSNTLDSCAVDAIGVRDPGLKLRFLLRTQCDPVGSPRSQPAGRQMAAFDPVIDHARTDPKAIRDFADGPFFGLLERGRRDVMPESDPFDHAGGEGLAFGTPQTVRIEGGDNLRVGERSG